MLKVMAIAWSVCATLIILFAIIISKHNPKTETSVFCAYNRIFVEFEEDGKKWGTMMLDYAGRPIPCKNDTEA